MTTKGFEAVNLLQKHKEEVKLSADLSPEEIEAFKRSQERRKWPWIKLKVGHSYKVEFLSGVRIISTPYGNRPVVDVKLLKTTDKDFRPDFYALSVYQSVLKAKLDLLRPLNGKVVSIKNLGKPEGKMWYDYAIDLVGARS